MQEPLKTFVRAGDMLAGKYRVEGLLGQGGMGAVYAATHLDLEERRAIKLMHASEIANANAVERFLREARAAARLKSEHVARVHDVGRLDDGVPYIVMEFLEGEDLKDLLRRRGALPIQEAVYYILQACDAIGEAHAVGIVHRDLKPGNLFLTARADGSPCIKVLDFGISKRTAPGGSGAALHEAEVTGTAEVIGSPHYMSPEQMRSTRRVDARTDLWSLGVILYKMITGRLPFEAESMPELFANVLERPPRPPSTLRPDIPPGLEAVILRCLEKDPARRTADVRELIDSLAPFAPGVDRPRRVSFGGAPGVGAVTASPPISRPVPASEPIKVAGAQTTQPLSATTAPWGRTGPSHGRPSGSTLKGRGALVGLAGALLGSGIGVAVILSTRAPKPQGVEEAASPAASVAEVPSEKALEPGPTASAAAPAPSPEMPAQNGAGSASAEALGGPSAPPSSAVRKEAGAGAPASSPSASARAVPSSGAGTKPKSTFDPFGRTRK